MINVNNTIINKMKISMLTIGCSSAHSRNLKNPNIDAKAAMIIPQDVQNDAKIDTVISPL